MWARKPYRILSVIKHDWTTPDQFRTRPFTPWIAWLLVLLLYVGSGYASSTWRALDFLRHGLGESRDPSDLMSRIMDLYIQPVLLAATLFIITRRSLRPERKQLTRERPVWSWLATFVAFYFLTMSGFILKDLLSTVWGGGTYPRPEQMTTSQQIIDLASSAAAGPREEIFLLAVPFLLLRSARCRWWSILIALATIRMSFHIYYGWAVLGMLVWAAGAVMLYRLTQRVIPMIIAHSMIDLASSIDVQWADNEPIMVALLLYFMVFLLLGVLVASTFTVCRRSRRSPQEQLPSSEVAK